MHALFSEPFIESIPQVHILLTLWVEEYELLVGSERLDSNNKTFILFVATFSTSIVSASLGIAKFLKLGPCRLIPNEGILGGYGSLNFLLLLLNVACTICSKAIFLASSGDRGPGTPGGDLFRDDYKTFKGVNYLLWITLCILPQLIYVSNISILKVYLLFPHLPL